MRGVCGLLVAGLLVALPSGAWAQITLTDWQGRSAEFEERSVDSGGVEIVYYTAGEGPLGTVEQVGGVDFLQSTAVGIGHGE